MLKNCDIVCFGPSDWWSMNPSCATHIMRRLAADNRVVYVNPVSCDLLGIQGKNGVLNRIKRKTKSVLKFIRKTESNLYVVSPVFLPIQGIDLIDKINNILLRMQVGLVMYWLGIKGAILWVENVRWADIIKFFRKRLVVYHVSDLFELCPYTNNKDKLRQRERHISENSDLLICVSKELYRAKQKTNSNAHYLPHGVDFELFRKAADNGKSYNGFENISNPIAGYFGTLTAENDIELLEYCAENLPEVYFVFAGEITAGDYSKLMQMGNTVFLGKVAYADIPDLCAVFDLCLLPWKMTEWMANCNPLKLLEYMASGRPIVSVPINEIADKYCDVVSIAATKEDFCRAIRWELQNDTDCRREKRISIAHANRWENHNNHLCEIIEAALKKGRHQNHYSLKDKKYSQ